MTERLLPPQQQQAGHLRTDGHPDCGGVPSACHSISMQLQQRLLRRCGGGLLPSLVV